MNPVRSHGVVVSFFEFLSVLVVSQGSRFCDFCRLLKIICSRMSSKDRNCIISSDTLLSLEYILIFIGIQFYVAKLVLY